MPQIQWLKYSDQFGNLGTVVDTKLYDSKLYDLESLLGTVILELICELICMISNLYEKYNR